MFCGKTNESKTNEFSMSLEVELTTVIEAEHVERGAEVDATGVATGVGRSEVSFADLNFFSNCVRMPSPTETGLTSMKLDVDLTGGVAILDGGHSGDAREVDERRSGPHRRERESDSRQSL